MTNSKDDDKKQIQAAQKRKKTKELLKRKNLKIECKKAGHRHRIRRIDNNENLKKEKLKKRCKI